MRRKMLKICILAGEASGDIIGAKLVRALRKQHQIELIGLGGAELQAEGMQSFFDIKEISIMGFAEVLPKVFKIKILMNKLAKYIIAEKPDIIITIDSYGFNTRIVKMLRSAHLSAKFVHYVAPTVWAYKPQRAEVIASLYDLQLALLPCEKKYFDAVGLSCKFVGHPIVEDVISTKLSRDDFMEKHNIPSTSKILMIMPGSRLQEVKNHAKLFADALRKLKRTHPNLIAIIPTFERFSELLKAAFKDLEIIILTDKKSAKEAMNFADAALVKSGTSSLETAHFNIPTVVAYKMNPLSYWYIKNKIEIKYISLVNILNNAPVISERIQSDATVENISADLQKLLNHTPEEKLEKYQSTFAMLGKGDAQSPSQKAASAILALNS